MSAIQPLPSAPVPARRAVPVGVAGVLIAVVLLVFGLLWAKWIPYARKADLLGTSHTWSGGALFAESGAAGTAPTLSGAWRFATGYAVDVWKGFTVALVAAAAIDALVPRRWLQRLLNRRSPLAQALVGGTAALPSLMCTCCTAPLAVGLRRRGVGTAASLAYWIGNPVLNPAVLLFLFLVAPWQFGLVRLLVGAALVFGASAAVARLLAPDEGCAPPGAAVAAPERAAVTAPADPARLREFPVRFARSLGRLAVVLIPAYFLVMLAVGALSGWLSDFSALDAKLGVLAVLACALIGTMLVIPTGGEIPVVLALSGGGAALASAGALLIALPALSVPSMVMVGRALSWRVTVAMAAAVAVAGLVAGTLLWILS